MLGVIDETRIAIEFEYLVRGLKAVIDGEYFRLRDQGAQPLSRYDVVKDVGRLERFSADDRADVGYAVVLSNDPQVWSPGRAGSIDEAFRMHDGATLSGTIRWAPHAGSGTTRGREKAIVLRGTYSVGWLSYPSTNADLRTACKYLIVTVGA
ncbi:MAG: hypothetical protein IPM45_04220 [Acidimicrobiales bacterium]|nr:hypothetical protein [Acidimicrobiales bacterium]